MALIDIKVPDIGDFDEVAVIELLVKPGDVVKAEQSLITVESDKASMEIPCAQAGVVKELKVKLGDKVKQGSVLCWYWKASRLLHPLTLRRLPHHKRPVQLLAHQPQLRHLRLRLVNTANASTYSGNRLILSAICWCWVLALAVTLQPFVPPI
jgi:hypothetical protein